jgi:hypothetical protein
MADTAFAMIREDADTVAVIEYEGVCWPYKSAAKARAMASKIGAAGIWRLKPRHLV